MCDHPCWLWSFDYSGPFGTVSILSPGNLVQEVPAPLAQSVHPTFLHTTGAECRPNSGLPGLPVLAFLIRNVFVATFVPKMAAGGSPEVTLVSIYWATSSQSGQRERRQRHSEMHRKHIEYKRTGWSAAYPAAAPACCVTGRQAFSGKGRTLWVRRSGYLTTKRVFSIQ